MGPSGLRYAEKGTDPVATYSLAGPESDSGRWMTLGGADAGDFRISNSGVLTFARTPDFETPADADMNNVYMVTLTATDSERNTAMRDVVVTVTDVEDTTTVIGGTLLERYDTNPMNGLIDQGEMRVAVGHFFAASPQLTTEEMRKLVSIYFSS